MKKMYESVTSRRSLLTLIALGTLLLAPLTSRSQPVVEDSVLPLIEAQGLEQSRVMEIARMMTDVYGPRLTGSPQLDRASAWAMDQLAEWGVTDSRLDDWGPFGRGWSLERFSFHVTEPNIFIVNSQPKAWSSSTNGPIIGELVVVEIKEESDFARYDGALAGKFVLMGDVREVKPHFEPLATRNTPEDLLKLANAGEPGVGGRRYTEEQIKQYLFDQKVTEFIFSQGAAAIFDSGWKGDLGTVAVGQASVPGSTSMSWYERRSAWHRDVGYVVPQVAINSEDYNRLYRMVKAGIPVKGELDLRAKFHDEDPMEYNIIAEIDGTDPLIGDEIVMFGGHYDSWHAGTGATDNAAGSAVMMEVMRILKNVYGELGRGPRRTLRLALWTGEEQGLLGSKDWVEEHVAVAGDPGQPPKSIGPEYDKISAYYNLDNGSGRIRGIYLQGNEQLRPVFRRWLAPFANMDASTVTVSNTTGTDHLSFDAVGIPGFQFIQDSIEYGTRTHHTNMDVYDRLVEDDLKQAATIIASFVYNTSERNEKIPRKDLHRVLVETGTE
ncbi:MAG TPA: M28 family peptidase [Rhodothermia bacterium]